MRTSASVCCTYVKEISSRPLQHSNRACISVKTGDVQLVLPWVASSLGYVYALSGRLREALPLLEQAVEQSAKMRQVAYYLALDGAP